MKGYLTLHRLAAVLLGLIFVGHTAGAMLAQQSLGAASDAVFASMKSVHFDFNGSDATWYGFWFGFGLMLSVLILFAAILAWQLDKVPPERWKLVSVIAWSLAGSQLLSALLASIYFFIGPAILHLGAAALLAAGNLRKQSKALAQPR